MRWRIGLSILLVGMLALIAGISFTSVPAESSAPFRLILTIDSLRFGRDSLKVGDSVQATAIPYGSSGRVCETCSVDWYDYPLSKINIRIKDLYGHVAWIVATGAAANTKMSVRWKRTSNSILRDTDSIKTYVVAPPPTSEVPVPTGDEYQLISTSGGCLQGTLASSGAPILVTTSCSASDSLQQWIPPAPNVVGTLVAIGKCLADSAGVKIELEACSTNPSQKWVRSGYTGTYQNQVSGQCLAVTAVTHLVVPDICDASSNKNWTTEPTGAPPSPAPTPPPSSDATCTSADSAVAQQSHPNEPVGMTVLHTHAGIQVTPCGWFGAAGTISVETDPTKGSVLQLTMKGLTTPGSGTASIGTKPEIGSFGATKVYIAFWEKLSPTFKGNNGAGSLKNVIIHTQANYGGLPNPAFHFPGFFNDPSNIDSRIQVAVSIVNAMAHDGIAIANPPNNVLYYQPNTFDRMSRGVWHFIEGVYTTNARGVANGSMQVWIDGQAIPPTTVNDVYVDGLTGSQIRTAYDGTLRITGIQLTNVWGGGGTSIDVDNYYRFKDLYVSGGYARAGETPDHWVLTSYEGTTVAPGTAIHVTAQLVDGNGNSVDICGLQPILTTTNAATWEYWPSTDTPSTGLCDYGKQFFKVTIPGGGSTLTATDYATKWNGQRGATRTGNLAITTSEFLSSVTPSQRSQRTPSLVQYLGWAGWQGSKEMVRH